jgi:hypothetical protein
MYNTYNGVDYTNWGNLHCCVCSDMYWQPVGNGPWNETVSSDGAPGHITWDDVWSYQMELSYDNRTWCNLTIANFTQDYYGTGWGSEIDFNNRTWCNETTNGANWNNGTCADGACNGGTWYNNTCTDGTWVTIDYEEWGPYTTCYPISANITEVLRDPEHAQCGSRINYNDANILNQYGDGCGDYAANHESWCGEYGDTMGDNGWGKSECCRCQEWWTPTEPSHYGYYDLPANEQNWNDPNPSFGNNTWGNDTSSNNVTNGNNSAGAAPYIQTPYVPYFEGGPSYEVGYDNRTWCNLTAANFTEDYYGTGWGLDIMWDERPWCANGGECIGASCGPNPNDGMLGGEGSYPTFPIGYMDTPMSNDPSPTDSTTVSNGHTFSGMCNNSSWPADRFGDGCDRYVSSPDWCSGKYDQGSFYDIECCACDSYYGRH